MGRLGHNSRSRSRLTALLVAVLASGCAIATGADASSSTAAVLNPLGVVDAAQLPDPCALLDSAEVASLLGVAVARVGEVGAGAAEDPLFYRTCTWGDVDTPTGAIGIQIGTSNDIGHDVVLNRSSAMEPAVEYPDVPGGKEAMNVGVMPTGGARGTTVFFQIGGYSVLVAQVGQGVARGDVEDLGVIVYQALSG